VAARGDEQRRRGVVAGGEPAEPLADERERLLRALGGDEPDDADVGREPRLDELRVEAVAGAQLLADDGGRLVGDLRQQRDERRLREREAILHELARLVRGQPVERLDLLGEAGHRIAASSSVAPLNHVAIASILPCSVS
jgi:hypothetical protein